MKKFLLGTTAVVAATAFSGVAFAQSASEPIKLGLGGYWRGAGAQQVNSGGNANNEHFRQTFMQDSAVYFKGDTKFDNGLHVGVMIQLRGEAADQIKRSYVRFFGDFGEVRFGDDEESRLQKALYAPVAGSLFGPTTPFFSFTNNPVGTNTTSLRTGPNKRNHRIAYFSPTIAGFSFAASYAPDNRKGNLISGTTATSNNAGQQSQTWSVAGLYDNKFGDFALKANFGYSHANDEGSGAGDATPRNNFSAWNTGLNVGWGPITVGGSFEHTKNPLFSATDVSHNVFDLGALYTIGPFSASIDWSKGYYHGFAGANSTSTLDVYEIVGDYVLGPGVSVGAALQFNRYHSGVTPAAALATQNEHDAQIELGTAFTF